MIFKINKKKLLIAGGSGFIATHLIKYLQTFDKYEITVLDIVPPKAENVKFIQASISELTKIEPILNNIDCVFNLAAMIGVDNCAKNPDAVMQVNYVDTKTFLIYV
jgi:nucleoside-diphosphate-sugar epimerase